MVTSASLKDQLAEKVRLIDQLTAGLSDESASKAPAEGEWCAKEILSHLAGSETRSFADGIKSFLEEDTPEYPITPGDTYMGPSREGATVQELRQSVLDQYREIGDLVGNLSAEQLTRTAHMPGLKETPIGEYPPLSLWIGAIINFHLPAHIQQLENLTK
ncbi:MAG: DinB family protein [Dehalococcoidia bacterium]